MWLVGWVAAGAWPPDNAQASAEATRVGAVVETFDSGGFTYAELDIGGEQLWVAGPTLKVAVGDTVATSEGALMADFHSRTLGRSFERIWFVAGWRVLGAEPVPLAAGPVPAVAGARSVADVLAHAAELRGGSVSVVGRVAKVTPAVLGRTWVHLQDGAADLTVTTQGTVEEGQVVVVQGRLDTDRDFGSGYRYAVLLEDATIERTLSVGP